jgi:GNAT superfamily N-acetyltransferase
VPGLEIRTVDPRDESAARHWADLFVETFAIEGRLADAWLRFNPILVRSHGYHQLIAALDGRDVAVATMFTRRRVAWLGAAGVLPDVRGRGIQRALIADRVRRAEDAGNLRAMATAELGSPSAANLEAMGLSRIWTRASYRVATIGA